MIPTPMFRNANETDAEREQRLEDQLATNSTRSKIICVLGLVALVAFAVCAVMGLPQAGVLLVPIGMGMLLGSGIELLLGRIAG